MTSARLSRVRRLAPRLALSLAAVLALSVIAFLPFAGRYLAADDPLTKADLAFVLDGAKVERWLETVDLYREGWAPRIVLSPGPQEPAEEDLRRMGVTLPADADIARDALVQLGIPPDAITILPHPVDNTAEEAAALRSHLAAAPSAQRVIVVTSRYHTRRTGVAFARAFHGTSTQITVRATRYDRSTPDRWWQRRQDLRFVTSELPKLLAYYLGLGE